MSIARRLAIATLATKAIVPLSANAGTFTTLYSFTGKADGAYPTGQLNYHGGELYGTTRATAGIGNGTVFSVNAATGRFKSIYAFQGAPDGNDPESGVVFLDGVLYGTTWFGGGGCPNSDPIGCGTIFSINAKTDSETVVYSFLGGGPVGAGELVDQAGTLYGTTFSSGSNGAGSVFTFNPTTSAFATLTSFGGTGGINPNQSLLYENGLFYGTTMYGGKSCMTLGGCGVVFSIDPASGSESVIHSFGPRKGGKIPYYTDLAYYAGSLFSDTKVGGNPACIHGCGVSFRIKATTGHETILEEFANGGEHYSGITIVGGNAYETLPGGGNGHGELLEVNLKSGQQTVLYTFTGGADGSDPMAALTYYKGAFYGTTDGGNGTVFKFVP